jgi:hypothetical protein
MSGQTSFYHNVAATGLEFLPDAFFYRNVAPLGLFYQGQSPDITVAEPHHNSK